MALINTKDEGTTTTIVATLAFVAESGLMVIPDSAVVETGILISDLPTTDPAIPGAIWNNAGVIHFSGH